VEPIQFLRSHPPFDRLGPDMLSAVEDGLDVAFVAEGTRVLERGGPRSRWLYVIRKGAVRLERDGQIVDALEEGECFGFPSLIGRAVPHVDVVASEETLLYRIPEDVFARLMDRPAFAEFFLLDLSERLRKASALDPLPLGRELGAPSSRLVTRAPVSVSPDATVRDAARVMRDASISSVLVDGEPQGILTVRDLSRRVLAEGLGPDTRVAEVMTRPVKSLPAEASLFEALLFMLEHRVHHAPLSVHGEIVGMVSDTDLLKVQGKNPFHVLDGTDDPSRLAGYADELAEVVDSMAAGGLDAVRIGRVVSRLNDALVGRLLRRAETDLGPPPCDYAWIVFGSEGRMEQALITDQDNALVYRDDTPEAAAYFAALARRGVDGLLAASFPECRGGFMATNWCRSLSSWTGLFRGWVETPEPRALVEASNFFDFRRVHGTLDLEPLEAILGRSSEEKLFLAHLARCAIGFAPPLGLFRNIREDEGGVELKKGGLIPIVSLARLFALEAGSAARPTLERLDDAARGGALSGEGAATLAEAFRFLLGLRLRDQLRARREGRPLDNKARLDSLSPLERRHLKDTFVAIRDLQEATKLRYALDRLG
jgi:CBS domain-containing protein